MKKQIRGAPYGACILAVNIAFSTVLLTGCERTDATVPVSTSGIYFDTCITVSLYDYPGSSSDILKGCSNMCSYYDGLLSSEKEGSDVWNINHGDGGPVTVSEETAGLIEDALYYCDQSEGKIDITLGGISDLWDFSGQAGSDDPVVPNDEDISQALTHVDYGKVHVNDTGDRYTVTLDDPDAKVELGFIAKGYIADRLKKYLETEGVTSAIINLGGNVYALGCKPDGSDFTIGIQKPFDDMGGYITTVHVRDMSVVSSGVYERYFEKDGILYHHILDPATGYPVSSDLYGVSIECPSSEKADALSTLCFVLGPDEGMKLIESTDDAECMYICSDYTCETSSGWK